jgi:hypothetical protein
MRYAPRGMGDNGGKSTIISASWDEIVSAPVAISKPDNDSEKLIFAVADIDAMKAHAAQRKPEADVEIADEYPNDMKRQPLSIRLGGRSPRGPRFPGVKDRPIGRPSTSSRSGVARGG